MAMLQRDSDPVVQERVLSAGGKDAEGRLASSFGWCDEARASLPKRHSADTHEVQLITRSVDGFRPSHPGPFSSSGKRVSESLSQGVTSASVTANTLASSKHMPWFRKSGQFRHRVSWRKRVPAPLSSGLSRWVVLVLYCLYCVFSGPAYINWTPIADVLFKAGAFEWRCADTTGQSRAPQSSSGMAKCEDQEAEVNRLFTITAASHFFFSFIGGSLLDFFGPKVTALVGLTFGITGWSLLGLANQSFRAYIPGCLLIGAGLDTTYFPLLSGANLFPGHVATVKAIFGAALSFSFLVPIVFRSIYFRPEAVVAHSTIFVCFAGICLGISFLIALFVIPPRPWPAPYKPFGQQQRDQPLAGGCGVATQSGDRLGSSSASHEQLDELLTVPPAQPSRESENHPEPCTTLVAVAVFDPPKEEKPCIPEVFPPTEKRSHGEDGYSPSGLLGSSSEKVSWKAKLRRQMKSCQRDFCSLVFIPIIPFFCLVLTGVVFFIPSARHLMPDAYAANRIIQIFSFLPCPLFGHIADVWGIMPVMYICNACGLLSFSLVMIPGIPAAAPLQYAASLLAASQLSFLVCQICCYVAETFDEENQGKLIGFLCCMAGLTSLSAHPIMDYSVRHGFRSALLAFVGSSCFNILLLLFVHWQKKKMGRVPQRTSEIKRQRLAASAGQGDNDGQASHEDQGSEQQFVP